MKMTRQRKAILEYLQENREHPSVYSVFEAVSKKIPSLCLATVYNTLETLKREGYIQDLSIDPVRKRFDGVTEPHHHLICLLCGEVFDVDGDYHFRSADGTEITVHHVDVYGECPRCRTGQKDQVRIRKDGT